MLTSRLKSAVIASAANYIEDVFSTYLYAGNGSTQTITNGIDLSTNGGAVYIKARSGTNSTEPPAFYDTLRGAGYELQTSSTAGQSYGATRLTAFNSNGFSLGSNSSVNGSSTNYVGWTFREQPKFFDVVTYTGNGTAGRTVAHNLGSVPGCMIVKRTDTTNNWHVYHRAMDANPQSYVMYLNLTNAKASTGTTWNNTAPTSTIFTLGDASGVNASGGTYVAYLFAHDAGGFGASGTDNVISCGSYVGNGGVNPINLGYEAQWVFVKRIDSDGGDWWCSDITRGMTVGSIDPAIAFNSSNAENTSYNWVEPRTNGFALTSASVVTTNSVNGSGFNYIYIAIRRGPMKTPTDATKVFGLSARTGTGVDATVTGGTGVDDTVFIKNRGASTLPLLVSRLTGINYLGTSSTAAEVAAPTTILQANPWDVMDGIKVGTTSSSTNASANTFINYLFSRAPGFFDVVCYTGTGTAGTFNHNLGAVPELMIVKRRTTVTANWAVYAAPINNDEYLFLNTTDARSGSGQTLWNTTTPTSTVFSVGTSSIVNSSSASYIAYLFATLAGVSKVGSYTGNGSSQTIACGFTAGARFVLIKRTDSTGDWYVWDTARGIVSGNDPHLSLNTTVAEVTTDDTIDPDNSGFIVNQVAATNVNVNAASYIFLAIA